MNDAYGLQQQLQQLQAVQNVYNNQAQHHQAMLNAGNAWKNQSIGGYGMLPGGYINGASTITNPNMQQALQEMSRPQKSRHISNIAWLDSRVNEIRVKL